MPVKRFRVAAALPCRRPATKADPIAETRAGFELYGRRKRCWKDPGRPTSTTGARLTLTPTLRRLSAVARPSARARAALPIRPSSAGDRPGGPERRFTRPPSWSIITSSGARRPGGRGMDCRLRMVAARPALEAMFEVNRITPAASPRAIRALRAAGGLVPEYE